MMRPIGPPSSMSFGISRPPGCFQSSTAALPFTTPIYSAPLEPFLFFFFFFSSNHRPHEGTTDHYLQSITAANGGHGGVSVDTIDDLLARVKSAYMRLIESTPD